MIQEVWCKINGHTSFFDELDILYYNKTMNEKEIRLNKYLSDCGLCSRRAADRLIADGRITVDGRTAQTGEKVHTEQTIRFDGKEVAKKDRDILLAYNKPRGIVCTEEKREKDNIIDHLDYPCRIFTVGRLDKNSEGLLLLTNMGQLADQIMRSRNGHEKEYLVRVDRDISKKFLTAMASGVPILNTVTRPCQITQTGRQSFSIVLTQGLNRQIRRMCAYFGYKVVSLKRVRIMNIHLGDLKPGEYREVTPEEKRGLYRSF